MFGNRKNNQNNRKSQQQSSSSAAVCTCPRCGYSIPHVPGIPCKSNICPTCQIMLLRGETSEKATLNVPEKQTLEEQTTSSPEITAPDVQKPRVFPIVDADLCIGCEACVESCPTNAIIMIDGKALIQNELCKKCRKCVRICPVGAIS